MYSSVLNYVFNLCILIGFVIPLLNLLTGWFGSFFGVSADIDADLDVGDIGDIGADVGDSAPASGSRGGLFPFNIMCLCLFLVVFGVLGRVAGRMMANLPLTVLLLAACLAVAALSYWALYRFIVKRLKESDSHAMSFKDLPGKGAEVTLGLSGNSVGTISLLDSTGAAISFRAKIDPHLMSQMPSAIPKGEPVLITEVDMENKLCYISTYFNRESK